MKKGILPGNDPMVARSLRISRTTFYIVAAFSAALAANATITLEVLSSYGQAAILGFTTLLVGVVSASVATDILSRSSLAIGTLRTYGARREAVAKSMVTSLVAFGTAGSAVGATVGVGLVTTLRNSEQLVLSGTVINGFFVLGLSVAAIGVGVYAGVRA